MDEITDASRTDSEKAQALKTVTAGTTTIDTGSAIVISDNGFTLLAAEFGTSDVIHWAAWG